MKKIIVFLCLAFFSADILAQSDAFLISGSVVDGITKLPLQGASVFAQNTTIGTATDAQGHFTLKLLKMILKVGYRREVFTMQKKPTLLTKK